MKSVTSTSQYVTYGRAAWPALAICAAVALPGISSPAHALVINATFDSTITSQSGAAAIEAAINGAITTLEADITTPITVAIDFQAMTGGLGQSETGIYNVNYFSYYNALKAIDTAPGATAAQQSAFASLGAAPTSASSGNPVNGNNTIAGTAPNLRALGFNTPATVAGPGGTYDTIISLNTSITSPPNGLAGNYLLEAVAQHELDEAFGVGGPGTELGEGSLTGPVGVEDLFRYSAPGVRSYTETATNSPLAYLSADGGVTVASYFSQTPGADYADWLSSPIPAGFSPQIQDAFGTPGSAPVLGPNELLAFNIEGYGLAGANPVPEPMSMAIMLPGLLGLFGIRRRRKATNG